MLRKVLTAVCFSAVLGVLAAGFCFSQIKSGTITGRVTDSSGAVVPAASVTVTNEGTKVPSQTTTSGTGDYTVPFLEPGTYDITVQKEGFNTYSHTGVPIGVDTTARVDAQLTVGRTATVVEVKETGATALQTETASVGDSVASNDIANLPDMNHNPYYFATLQPEVTGRWQIMDNNGPMSFGVGVYAHVYWSAFSFNGSTTFTSNITLDGINTQGTAWNESDVSPNPDSLAEVKTYSNDFDASIGRGQGAVAMVTKSGTNSWHGSAFGRVRNKALNANTFLNDVQGDLSAADGYKPIPKPEFNVEYYGGTFGGPIKKDKAFFFASWQGMNHHTQSQQSLNVPMNNQAKGDFASPEGCPSVAAAQAAGGTPAANTMGTCVNVGGTPTPIQLANPFVATPVAGLSGIYQHPLVTGPAGISDESLVADPGFLAYASYYPKANQWPSDAYNDLNYFSSVPEVFTSNSVNSRVDLNHGKHNLYFTGGIEVGKITSVSAWGVENPPFYFAPGNNSGQTPGRVYDHSPYGGIGDTITVSPTLVIDAHVGVNRAHYINDEPLGPGFNHALFGMPASYLALLPEPTEGIETVDSPIGQWSTLDSAGAQHKNSHETNWDYAAGVTKVKGNWTLKFGFEYMDDFTDTPDVFYSGGAIQHDGCGGCVYSTAADATYTALDTTAATQGINDEGDFMMGAAWWDFNNAQSYWPAYLEQYFGLYDANTWKVTSHLTVNLGVRWDLQPAVEERRNAMMSWDPSDVNPMCSTPTTLAGVAAAGLPVNWGCQGTYWIPGVNGHSRRLWQTQYNNFAPRVGFAYRWHDNTVIRGGYGISYLPGNVAFDFGNGDYNEFPWGVGTVQNSQGPTPAGAQLYPMENPTASVIVPPPGANLLAPQVYGISYQQIISHYWKNGYMEQFNLFLERRLGGWLMSAGFVGARGKDLPTRYYTSQENTSLFDAPSVNGSNVISCFHAGLNCAPNDSSVAAAGGYLGNGADPYGQQVTNPFNPNGTLPFQTAFIAKTVARGLVDSAFPLFEAEPMQSIGYSSYNALQVEAKHQFGHGLMADFSYVWSKSESDSYFEAEHNQAGDTETGSNSGFQWIQTCPKCNRRYDLDDIPGRFVANIVYGLPFGAGHALNPSNKVASYIVGGWRVGATEMDESGYPLDITDDAPGSLDYRPNRVANEPLVLPKNLQGWYNNSQTVTLPDGRIYTPNSGAASTFLKFNPDAFSAPVIPNPTSAGKYINDTYWLGNSAINYGSLRDPSINNLNFSLTRDFKLTERFTFELQANVTNTFNHPNIETYLADLGGGTEESPSNSSNIPLGYSNGTSSYGTHNLTTFDFRQIELVGRLTF
jgi:hypothetical protein